jgi:hypothetical protein
MSDLASLYQKEVEDSISMVKNQTIPGGDLKGAESLLRQCEQTLTLLEKEARSAGGARKEAIMATAAGLRREVEALNQETKKKALFGRQRRGSSAGDDPERGGLLEDEEEDRKLVNKSKLALKKSTAAMSAMTEQGVEIQRQLEEQKNTMQSAMNKMNRTDALSQEGRRHLSEIERGELRNKIFMYGAVVIVFIGIVVMLYYVFFRA